MARSRFAWGIDVGNRALKAIKLVPDGDRLRVDDLEVIEHEQILSQSGDNRDSLVQSALQIFAQRHPIKGGAVAISLSGQASFARFIKLPPVEEKKIPEIVKFEAIQQIPFPLDEVEWAYQLFREPESTDVEVGIFAIRKDRLQPIIQSYTDLNIPVSHVQLGPLAVYNAMYYDQRLTGPTMLVDLGAENTDLVIADGETVWLRTIAVGGNNFTEALAKAFKLNFAKAEELKRNAATSKYARQIFQAMRPVFADLVSEIQRSIGFYASVHRESRIKRIIALGSTFRLPTLQKYLQQNLQMEVDRIDSFGTGGGTPADARIAATLNENIASLTTAYGLAVQAMGDGKITNTLLPEDIRKAKLWQSKIKWFGIAAACVVIGTGAGYGKWYLDKQNQDAGADASKKADAVLARAGSTDAKWNQISTEGETQLAQITGMTQMLDYRDVWPKLITDLAKSLPPVPADGFASVERSARKQVIIESVQSEFRPDVSDLLKLDDNAFKQVGSGNSAAAAGDRSAGGAAASGGTAPIEPIGATPRGFLLTLRCLTPNADGPVFLQDQNGMLANLMKITPKLALNTGRPYYIAKSTVASRRQIGDAVDNTAKPPATIGFTGDAATVGADPGAGAAPGAASERAVGRGGRFDRAAAPVTPPAEIPAAAPGAAVPPGPAFPDPLDPKQDMIKDWDLTVLVLVVLDPPKPNAPPDALGAKPARTAVKPTGAPLTDIPQ